LIRDRTLDRWRVEFSGYDHVGGLAGKADQVARIGVETGPLAAWLWNKLTTRGLPIVCLDARHANAALSMMPSKTDRHDAAGLPRIVRTGWFKQVHVKSHGAPFQR